MGCKNEIYAKNWVRSTWTTKPGKSQQSIESQRSMVHGQLRMTSTDDASVDDVRN